MYKDIAVFLNASPEWVEAWLNTPVTAKYKPHLPNPLNPMMLPDIIALILKQVSTFDMIKYRINTIWREEVHSRLRIMHHLLVSKREKLKEECREAHEKWKADMEVRRDFKESYKKMTDLDNERVNTFFEQVEIENVLINLGLASDAIKEKNNFHIRLYADGLEPEDVDLSRDSEWDPNYWGDEDPNASQGTDSDSDDEP